MEEKLRIETERMLTARGCSSEKMIEWQ